MVAPAPAQVVSSPDSFVQQIDSPGLNGYSYVRNRPTSAIDPTGNFDMQDFFTRLEVSFILEVRQSRLAFLDDLTGFIIDLLVVLVGEQFAPIVGKVGTGVLLANGANQSGAFDRDSADTEDEVIERLRNSRLLIDTAISIIEEELLKEQASLLEHVETRNRKFERILNPHKNVPPKEIRDNSIKNAVNKDAPTEWMGLEESLTRAGQVDVRSRLPTERVSWETARYSYSTIGMQ